MLLPMSGALLSSVVPMSGALLSSVVPMSGALLYSVVPMSGALLSSVAADVRCSSVAAADVRCSSVFCCCRCPVLFCLLLLPMSGGSVPGSAGALHARRIFPLGLRFNG